MAEIESAAKLELATCREMGRACLGFNLRRADRAIMQVYDDALRSCRLRATQFSLLMVTRALEPVTLSELADRLGMDRTTLSRNLGPLEQSRWITLEPGEDRRERNIRLTQQGHTLLVKAHPTWARVQARLAKAFGKAEMQRLVDQLQKVTAASRAA